MFSYKKVIDSNILKLFILIDSNKRKKRGKSPYGSYLWFFSFILTRNSMDI